MVSMTQKLPDPHPFVALTMSAVEKANIAGVIYGSFMLLLICRHITQARHYR